MLYIMLLGFSCFPSWCLNQILHNKAFPTKYRSCPREVGVTQGISLNSRKCETLFVTWRYNQSILVFAIKIPGQAKNPIEFRQQLQIFHDSRNFLGFFTDSQKPNIRYSVGDHAGLNKFGIPSALAVLSCPYHTKEIQKQICKRTLNRLKHQIC